MTISEAENKPEAGVQLPQQRNFTEAHAMFLRAFLEALGDVRPANRDTRDALARFLRELLDTGRAPSGPLLFTNKQYLTILKILDGIGYFKPELMTQHLYPRGSADTVPEPLTLTSEDVTIYREALSVYQRNILRIGTVQLELNQELLSWLE